MCSIVSLPTQLHAAKRQPYSSSLSIENFPCPLKLRRWRTAAATHSFEDRGRRGRRPLRCAPQGFMAFNAKEGRRKREGEGSAQRILDIVARLLLCSFLPSVPPSSADILRLSLQRLPRLGTVAGAGGSPSLFLPHSLPSPSCRVQTDRNREGSEEQERDGRIR